ncbi:MAG: sialidase family protein [Flavobacteriales bacterium]
MRLYLLIGCVSLLALKPSAQVYQNIQIPPVSSSYAFNECEPSIAINPLNPKEIAAGTVLTGYHFSKDGGKTWQTKSLKSPYGVYGDPVLQYDAKGRLYYFHLSDYKKTSHLDRIVCQYTDRINGTFSKGSFPAPNGIKVQDKHWMVIDPQTQVIYMTWTQFDAYDSSDPKDTSVIVFSKSTDRGLSWTNPIRISKYGGDCLDGDNTVEGAVPALGANGEIYVCWTGPRGIMFQCSKDGGITWLSEERKLADHVGGWDIQIPGIYRANGLPFLMADMSGGPRNGMLYLNWCDQRNGADDTDVWLMSSADGGTTWSEPKRVNQDAPGKHQFLTSMAIDQKNGDLHFVYYDRRRFNTNSTDVIWAKSTDGGQSFSEQLISNRPFLPDARVFFGDYLGIAAHDGIIRPIWPRMDNGKITLWTALIDPQ